MRMTKCKICGKQCKGKHGLAIHMKVHDARIEDAVASGVEMPAITAESPMWKRNKFPSPMAKKVMTFLEANPAAATSRLDSLFPSMHYCPNCGTNLEQYKGGSR